MKSIFEKNGGTYTRCGDYYIPDLSIPDTKKYNIGKYGRLHAKFIRQNRPAFYSIKMLDGTWLAYLEGIDISAKEMVDTFIKELVAKQCITEELKATNQFAWLSAMERIKHIAEEIVLNEYVYKILR